MEIFFDYICRDIIIILIDKKALMSYYKYLVNIWLLGARNNLEIIPFLLFFKCQTKTSNAGERCEPKIGRTQPYLSDT